MMGLSRERPGPSGSSGLRILAFLVLALASVGGGIYAAFRREAPIDLPAAQPVVTEAPLPTPVMPPSFPAPTLSPVAPEETTTTRLVAPPMNAPPAMTATASALAESPLDAAAAPAPARSAPPVASAAPIAVSPRKPSGAGTYVHPEPVPVPVAPPIVTTSIVPRTPPPDETPPPAPPPAPTSTTDPTFGL
jgi:DNA polymerase-3 subunit gamma/tau